jgi:LmbE family N-acetylglucosaminyl deacetylase
MSRELDVVAEGFSRAIAVVAHPDDLEYGAASAISRWTRSGRSVAYVIVTDGEAGIDGMSPVEAGPLRQKEQVVSTAVVGVDDVTFLGHSDGVVENGLDLRRDIAHSAGSDPTCWSPPPTT